MCDEKRHIQLRLSPDMHQELEEISNKFGISTAELVRGVLFMGIPVFESLTELRGKLVERFVKVLKKEARQEKTK